MGKARCCPSVRSRAIALPGQRSTKKEWRQARDALGFATGADPWDRQLRAALHYCEGHLRRIDGEARLKNKQVQAGQQELTLAVTAFREAAELRQNWPDPFLGLMRVFIATEDIERGADALAQAQRYGYAAGNREWAMLGEGYLARAVKLADSDDLESLTRAEEAYSKAIEHFSKAATVGSVAQRLRETQRRLKEVQDRIEQLSASQARRTHGMSVTYTTAAERDSYRLWREARPGSAVAAAGRHILRRGARDCARVRGAAPRARRIGTGHQRGRQSEYRARRRGARACARRLHSRTRTTGDQQRLNCSGS